MKPLGQAINPYAYEKSESPIEVMMFNALANNPAFTIVSKEEPAGEGKFIYPQYEVGPYRADIIIKAFGYPCCPKVYPPRCQVTVCVECDGREFHTSDEQRARDKKRDEYFKDQGISTLRFSGSEIYKNPSFCAVQVQRYIDNELWGAK